MYKTRKKIVTICVYALAVILFIGVALFIIPLKQDAKPSIYSLLAISTLFWAVVFLSIKLKGALVAKIYHATLEKGETVILKKFIASSI